MSYALHICQRCGKRTTSIFNSPLSNRRYCKTCWLSLVDDWVKHIERKNEVINNATKEKERS